MEPLPPHVAEYLDRVVADWPPLSDEQKTRLAELLTPVRIGGGDARA